MGQLARQGSGYSRVVGLLSLGLGIRAESPFEDYLDHGLPDSTRSERAPSVPGLGPPAGWPGSGVQQQPINRCRGRF